MTRHENRTGELLKELERGQGERNDIPVTSSNDATKFESRKSEYAETLSRRAGLLLAQIETQQGARSDLEHREGDRPKLSRTQAADEAGLSDWQRKQALRLHHNC